MTIHIGLIGDCDLQVKAHVAIPLALELAASELGCKIKIAWLATPTLEQKGKQALAYYGAFWAVPGTPYVNMDGALNIEISISPPSF